MINQLDEFWQSHLIDSEFSADNFKHTLKERWVRFHALPDSKRYPENELEYQVIYSRHNSIIKEFTADDTELVLVLSSYTDENSDTKLIKVLKNLYPNSQLWKTLNPFDDDKNYFQYIHAVTIPFKGGLLDPLFRLVADDQINNVMIINLDKKILFHPYDGGMDIVLSGEEEKKLLKHKFSSWLSSNPEGY